MKSAASRSGSSLPQHGAPELHVGNQLQPVQDGVLPVLVHALVGLVDGLDGVIQDGLHPGTPLLPQPPGDPDHGIGGAVAVGEDAGVQQVDAGRSPVVGQVDEPHPAGDGLRHLLQQARHQVGVGVHHDDGVVVPARRLLPELVGHDVLHQRGLAHAGAGHVEVMAAQQVLGEVDLPGSSGGGLSHRRAAPHAAGRGQQRPGAGTLHQGRLVPLAGRVPQGGRLADPQDAALAEQPRPGGMEVVRGQRRPHAAYLEPGAGGVVVVAVGGGHRLQDFPGPLLPHAAGQDGDDLELALEGDAAHLLLDDQRVVDPAPGLLPAPPAQPARPRAEPAPSSDALRISPSWTHR